MQPRANHRLACALPLALFALAAPAAAATQEKRPEAPATAQAAKPSSEIVLAHVEGRALTLDEAIRTFLSSHTGHGVLIRGEPAVRELAGRLVERELFLLEAESLGIGDEPRTIEVVNDYRRTLAGDEFWNREVKQKVVITDEDVESFYSKTDVALRLTLIECATRETAEALRARVAAGEDMAAIARKESTHPSRTFDGALPYVRRGELERRLEEAAFALEQPLALSPVVASERGFAFVRLEERSVNPERPPRETALPQIRGILEERATKKLAAEVEERAKADAGVWVDEAGLTREKVLDGPDATVIVAKSAGDSLTLADVREALDLEALRTAPAESGASVGVDLARQWARGEALMAAGEKAGLLGDPVIVEKTRVFRRDVMMKLLCDQYVWPKEAPTEAEIKAYYEERKATDFTTTPEARLAYIVLSTEAEANDVLAAIADGQSFELLARTRSKDSASSVHGGRIGWVKPGELLPEVERRAFALAADAVDGPIETSVGFFVIKAIEVKPLQIVPYGMAREIALQRMVKARQQEAYTKWALALRERASVELDEPGVAQAVAWLEVEALAREAEKAAAPKPSGGAPPGHGPAPALKGVKEAPKEQKP